VSVVKWASTCVSGNGPVYGEKFWYQLMSGVTSSVMMFRSFLAANLAQCIACWVVST